MSKGNRHERYSDIDEQRGGVTGMSLKLGIRKPRNSGRDRNRHQEVVDRTRTEERRTKKRLYEVLPGADEE